eukprot:CAMPEP_0197686222 /NCGR_PEP_ID=MMETSP1338-20131121/102168_1 /TAXON_ID=43686 ORGANISM="Pelagodinium beii, Strain RCC1491" /NCGR_SAMPLE_ID=MMETSP1338 /ASSEMBLY_ACC=CAM_ASM_000754 /LENGTH=33 /DNA_ID= /DNA_START= /DNA_END= /DNA_ORIENTATION=
MPSITTQKSSDDVCFSMSSFRTMGRSSEPLAPN